MRAITLVGFLAIVTSAEAYGQTALAPRSEAPIVRWSPSPLDLALSQHRWTAPPKRIHRCCNRKGALIGAAIGAAIGFGYATVCDAGNCTPTYIKYMAVMGGIGATLGAFVQRQSPQFPDQFLKPSDPRNLFSVLRSQF